VGCASAGTAPTSAPSTRAALEAYLGQVEPIRLAVNRLLETADPILDGFRMHRIGATDAAGRMDSLERRFASYTVAIQAIQPRLPALRLLHGQYAHTYVLEDAYLSALVSGLAGRNLEGLPNTKDSQRAAIIAWRTGLTILARGSHTPLPPDLQQAGRGEIAPSPGS
jgi:hypothetical protein